MSETASPPVAVGVELRLVIDWLEQLARADDLDDIAADGGVTVAMVYQQEAAMQARRLRALASPVSGDGSSADADTHPAPVPPVVGWQDISTAPRQEPVIVGHERLLGWRRMAICNALGEWSYYDRPWLQQDPLDEAPTHWMAWPDAPPTASVSPGMETLQASECTHATNGETIAQTCLRLAEDRTLNIIPAVRCALRMAHDALTATKHGEKS